MNVNHHLELGASLPSTLRGELKKKLKSMTVEKCQGGSMTDVLFVVAAGCSNYLEARFLNSGVSSIRLAETLVHRWEWL